MQWVLQAFVLVLALTVHECAHAFVADRRGDPTARALGRLTLNPLPHIDLFGTIIFPALLLIANVGVVFGWARPVPVNVANLHHPRRDSVLVSAAGPASNVLQALVFVALFYLLAFIDPPASASGAPNPLLLLTFYGVIVNIVLAVFNLIPLPPLDGGRVAIGLLPQALARQYARLEPFGMIILVVLLYTGLVNMVLSPLVRLAIGLLLGDVSGTGG